MYYDCINKNENILVIINYSVCVSPKNNKVS